MELNIKENSKNKLVAEIKGEDHTFCNILAKRLLANSNVKVAAYRIDHPMIRVPTLMVETSSGSPKDAILETLKGMSKEFQDFQKAFDKEV